MLAGCSSSRNYCKHISYLSLRPTVVKETSISAEADIAVFYYIDDKANINVLVRNLTDDILTIDQTKSFFVNSDQKSTAYYDPTIRTTTNTVSTGSSKGGSFNLGGLASAFGIGGIAGTLMNATTLGKSNTISNTSSHTEVMADLPQVSIGPRGEMAMSKSFAVHIPSMNPQLISVTPANSPLKFSVSIRYSFDNGETFDIITSEFYCNSFILENVYNNGTSSAVADLIRKKANATREPWFQLVSSRGDCIENLGVFLNYQ